MLNVPLGITGNVGFDACAHRPADNSTASVLTMAYGLLRERIRFEFIRSVFIGCCGLNCAGLEGNHQPIMVALKWCLCIPGTYEHLTTGFSVEHLSTPRKRLKNLRQPGELEVRNSVLRSPNSAFNRVVDFTDYQPEKGMLKNHQTHNHC